MGAQDHQHVQEEIAESQALSDFSRA